MPPMSASRRVTCTPHSDVVAVDEGDESTLTIVRRKNNKSKGVVVEIGANDVNAVQLNAQLQQLEINATNCVRDLASLVATLDAALREVNGIASEHMSQLSTRVGSAGRQAWKAPSRPRTRSWSSSARR
jgi:hypothetical protein